MKKLFFIASLLCTINVFANSKNTKAHEPYSQTPISNNTQTTIVDENFDKETQGEYYGYDCTITATIIGWNIIYDVNFNIVDAWPITVTKVTCVESPQELSI